MNILSKGICIRSTSYILLNQGYIRTFSLIPKLYAMLRFERNGEMQRKDPQ